MSREAFGDPPENQEAPDLCPVCGSDWHAEDCEFGKEVARRLKAERDAHRLAYALENVAMMLRKCAHRLKCNGHEDLSADAVGLLRRLDLLGSPLRREFECLGEPSLCENPRGCACRAPSEPHPSCRTPAGCRENGCLGWCDEHRPDPKLKPDIAALKKRLSEDPEFAAQVTGDRPSTPIGWSDTDWLAHMEKKAAPLRRGVNGTCIRSVCECEREGLGDQCIYLRPKDYPAYAKGPLPETGWD